MGIARETILGIMRKYNESLDLYWKQKIKSSNCCVSIGEQSIMEPWKAYTSPHKADTGKA